MGDAIPGFGFFLWIIIAGILLIVLCTIVPWFVRKYNDFYILINTSESKFNQIRVYMKKRLDLINQLREATESYIKFERGTFEGVTAMRSAVDNAKPENIDRIDTESKSLLGRLIAVVENYPDLKTNTLVTDLMASIRNVENEIAQHRYSYNTTTQEFNTLMDTIPSNFVGKIISLQKLKYIDFEEDITNYPVAASLTK